MTIPVLQDADARDRAHMGDLVGVIERYLLAKAAGRVTFPPRHDVDFSERGRMVFTVGGVDDASSSVAGFRAYTTFGGDGAVGAQVVGVWDVRTGNLLGLALGDRLGALRTGAIGGVAVKHLARGGATVCALIGAGLQAETQLLAVAVVRRLAALRVYSRDAAKRTAFAARLGAALGLGGKVAPASSAQAAIDGADIVVCATTSTSPVFEADWLAPGAHVTTVGPKLRDAHEIPRALAERADVVATDSIAQVRAYAKPHVIAGTRADARLMDLADVVAHGVRRGDEDLSLFCSVGLAGTEVAIADHMLRRA